MTDKSVRQMSIPVLRIFEVDKAKEFYCDFLEFEINWEHRFEPDFPIYMEIQSGECKLHLSEHHGDGTPGTLIRIATENIESLHESLLKKDYKYTRPGLEDTPWNMKEIRIGDPFGNRIIFYEKTSHVS
ncbi:glyoxalase superfamily protein [Sutcliffiella rhizosphaerae]|uniref:Bleomycin resistance protein n=1 Tax=Sutcliffiella rhizosphaerae TaxID=2880967 RepID=A0ABN8AH89_9BACI|nr:glyoxalase superfamily protein [Sutcliffiella rhizosphaerae]CAG9623711.1 hypothetical protein BACCIP111883_04543 [Sutcliffiella rhizosphaerae]